MGGYRDSPDLPHTDGVLPELSQFRAIRTKQLVHGKKGPSLLAALRSSPVPSRISSALQNWDSHRPEGRASPTRPRAPSLPPRAGGTQWLCPSPSWVPAADSAALQPP